MGQPASTPRAVIERVGLGTEITRLEKRIEDWVRRCPNAVQPMLQQQFGSDSKYFRPMLVFASHYAVSQASPPERVQRAAQAIEMLHNITLIIDDLVDESAHRRKKLTQHAKYNALTAYMVAGYIDGQITRLVTGTLVHEAADRAGEDDETRVRLRERRVERGEREDAVDRTGATKLSSGQYDMLAERDDIDGAGPVHFDLRLLTELKERLAIAECIQWDSRKDGTLMKGERRALDLGLSDWRFLAREDTGSMFEICACLGSRSQRFRRLGRLIGMLYHACDDIADIRSARLPAQSSSRMGANAERLGGTGNEDLEQGILTLPAALAIERDPGIRRLFSKAEDLTGAELNTLHAAFSQQLDRADAELKRIKAQALDELHWLNPINVSQFENLIEEVYRLSESG